MIIFNILGFQSAVGLTYGITLRLEQLVWVGIGLAVYAVLVGKMRARKKARPDEDRIDSGKEPENREATWRRT